jgi:hypothetical protein
MIEPEDGRPTALLTMIFILLLGLMITATTVVLLSGCPATGYPQNFAPVTAYQFDAGKAKRTPGGVRYIAPAKDDTGELRALLDAKTTALEACLAKADPRWHVRREWFVVMVAVAREVLRAAQTHSSLRMRVQPQECRPTWKSPGDRHSSRLTALHGRVGAAGHWRKFSMERPIDREVFKMTTSKEETVPETIEMTYAAWMKEGTRLFGPVRIFWGFVCPSCGHVQTPEDFRQYKDNGATPNAAYLNCIGRYDGKHGDVEMGTHPGPCNYTSGGFLNINPVTVIMPGDSPLHVFAFADPSGVPLYGAKKEHQP